MYVYAFICLVLLMDGFPSFTFIYIYMVFFLVVNFGSNNNNILELGTTLNNKASVLENVFEILGMVFFKIFNKFKCN